MDWNRFTIKVLFGDKHTHFLTSINYVLMVYIILLAIGFYFSCNPLENRVCFPVTLDIVKMGKCSNYAISAAAVFLSVPCAKPQLSPICMAQTQQRSVSVCVCVANQILHKWHRLLCYESLLSHLLWLFLLMELFRPQFTIKQETSLQCGSQVEVIDFGSTCHVNRLEGNTIWPADNFQIISWLSYIC